MKSNWKKIILSKNKTVLNAIQTLNKTGLQMIIVCDGENYFGTITDGDIRKGLIRGITMEDKIEKITCYDSTTVSIKTPDEEVLSLFKQKLFKAIPIIEYNKVVGCHFLDDFFDKSYSNVPILIMAGGFGKRMGDLTSKTPKPLLKIDGKPMIEHIIETAVKEEFKSIFISVHYLSKVIQSFVGDGSKYGIKINYIIEDNPLDTAGSFRLLEINDGPVLITNADIISKIGYNNILDYHHSCGSEATMAVYDHTIENPFGVVETDGLKLTNFVEKPRWISKINAGIYVIDSKLKKLIKFNERISMPDYLKRIISQGYQVNVFPLHEEWIDLGLPEEYEKYR